MSAAAPAVAVPMNSRRVRLAIKFLLIAEREWSCVVAPRVGRSLHPRQGKNFFRKAQLYFHSRHRYFLLFRNPQHRLALPEGFDGHFDRDHRGAAEVGVVGELVFAAKHVDEISCEELCSIDPIWRFLQPTRQIAGAVDQAFQKQCIIGKTVKEKVFSKWKLHEHTPQFG